MQHVLFVVYRNNQGIIWTRHKSAVESHSF